MMQESFEHHPHIGVCKMGMLQSTQDAIRMFNVVVQMGLEGIVIVNRDVGYRAPGGHFFKLKPKIVLKGRKFKKTGITKDVLKDGVKQTEHEFLTEVSNETVKFTDQQPRETGHARLKYMERIEAMKGKFPCNDAGYRHMHFATDYDMPVVVPCVSAIAKHDEDRVRDMLGLSGTLNLYNPRGFQVRDVVEETPIVPSKKYVFLCLNKGCHQVISQVGLICYVVDADGRRQEQTKYHAYIRESFADVVTHLVDVFRDTSVVTTLILPTDMTLTGRSGKKIDDVILEMMKSVETQEVFNLIRRLNAPLHSKVVSDIKIERMADREWSEKESGVADPTPPVSRENRQEDNVFEYACRMSMGYFDKLDARETGKRPKPEGSEAGEARDGGGDKEKKKEEKKPTTLKEWGRRHAGVYGRSPSTVKSLLMQLREMCV
jgi:hypothetical protein